MPRVKRDDLTEKEILFCEFWTEVVKRPDRIHTDQLNKAAGFLGMRRSGGCAQCLRNDAIELNNRFQLLYPIYNEYISKKKSIELIQKTQKTSKIDEKTSKIDEKTSKTVKKEEKEEKEENVKTKEISKTEEIKEKPLKSVKKPLKSVKKPIKRIKKD